MKTFFKKLFKRGDFMTRADKWYYSKVIKTWLWSTFAFVIIAWVGTNLVLCALSMNVKGGGDIIYEVPRKDVFLPTGEQLCKQITNRTNLYVENYSIYSVTFDYIGGESDSFVKGITPEDVSAEDEIYLYRANGGKDIYILSPNNMLANSDSSSMFNWMYSLKSVKFNNFDSQYIENISSMFNACENLIEVNMAGWNTKSLVNMGFVFDGCQSLTEIDLTGWDTSNVTTMASLFAFNYALKNVIGLNNLDVSSVEDMKHIFWVCSQIETIDLSGWDTRAATDMSGMFYGCPQLKTIYASEKFMTTNVTKSGSMFYNCLSLVGGNGTGFSSSKTDKTYARIDKAGQKGYFSAK